VDRSLLSVSELFAVGNYGTSDKLQCLILFVFNTYSLACDKLVIVSLLSSSLVTVLVVYIYHFEATL